MKTLRLLSLLVIGAALISSCDKDDEISTAEALERLQKTWKIDSISTVFFSSPTSATVTYKGDSTDYYDFRSDGKLYTQVNNTKDTLLYNLLNNNTLVVNNNGVIDSGKLTILNSSKLVGVTRTKLNATDYYEVTANLSR